MLGAGAGRVGHSSHSYGSRRVYGSYGSHWRGYGSGVSGNADENHTLFWVADQTHVGILYVILP